MRGNKTSAKLRAPLLMASLLALAACAGDEEPWPDPMAEAAGPAEQPAMAQPAPAPQNTVVSAPKSARPPLATLAPDNANLPNFAYTNSAIAPRVAAIRNEYAAIIDAHRARTVELARTRSSAVEATRTYRGTVAAIESRLQQSTTPGNPILEQQWGVAQGALSALSNEVVALNRLSADIASDVSRAGYLADNIRATLALPGALDEDHRQLHYLADAVEAESGRLRNLLSDASGDQRLQSTYVANEQANLATLRLAIKNGQLYGRSLAHRAWRTEEPLSASNAPAPNTPPLLVVRFDTPNPDYQQTLYTLMASALDRKPEAAFDLVAVTPASADPAQYELAKAKTKSHAQEVLAVITAMGLPAERLRLSSATSAKAKASEVHLYVR